MLANDRRMKILELLREEGSAKVSYLSKLFSVSDPTIRQDLEALEREGFVIREHGGAYLRSLSQQVRTMSLQHSEHLEEKRRIARTAVQYVNPGSTVILDSGSTTTEIAKLLVSGEYLTV
ncbi:MAG: DeoR family transcriptional regulator, partial [Spirochaetes bacterium]|nr:DeoR family transcriptional regulator [Spirochaetota bacterium]